MALTALSDFLSVSLGKVAQIPASFLCFTQAKHTLFLPHMPPVPLQVPTQALIPDSKSQAWQSNCRVMSHALSLWVPLPQENTLPYFRQTFHLSLSLLYMAVPEAPVLSHPLLSPSYLSGYGVHLTLSALFVCSSTVFILYNHLPAAPKQFLS